MAYPKILRQKALDTLGKGRTKKEVNELYGLSNTTLRDWEILEKETGSLDNRPLERKPSKIDDKTLREYCEVNPFAIADALF
jgi:transposase